MTTIALPARTALRLAEHAATVSGRRRRAWAGTLLVLLGVGWNFGFIGATAMLTSAHAHHVRERLQGMNDGIVMGCVTLASLASGGLMNCAGGSAAEGWQFVNLAMLPLLALAAGALVWLARREGDAA